MMSMCKVMCKAKTWKRSKFVGFSLVILVTWHWVYDFKHYRKLEWLATSLSQSNVRNKLVYNVHTAKQEREVPYYRKDVLCHKTQKSNVIKTDICKFSSCSTRIKLRMVWPLSNKENFTHLQGTQCNVATSGNINPPERKNLSRAAITESNMPSCRRKCPIHSEIMMSTFPSPGSDTSSTLLWNT